MWEPTFICVPTDTPDILKAVTTMNAAVLCIGHLATLLRYIWNFLALCHVTAVNALHRV